VSEREKARKIERERQKEIDREIVRILKVLRSENEQQEIMTSCMTNTIHPPGFRREVALIPSYRDAEGNRFYVGRRVE
jgi:hypothetical protein